ncbi:PEP-CTERM sorting domain-containing protein [Aliinostoc sp. HNIBRCY26]|uniref:PEP-CTERM sorting domain-containing protein n=1 Tax=Aliinostoc sp. HNIBRCY26 TaxID=3418997 RepID=UPI003D02675E
MATANLMKKFSIATAGVTCLALATLGTGKAEAAVIVLDFEGIGNLNPVGSFYDTAPQDFDITFSSNALAIVDEDAGGTGNFGGEPSPDTVLFFLDGPAATLNVANGFTDGFSFFYSAINNPGFVRVYDGLNATGNVLATIDLPLTPRNGAPDPTGSFSPFVPIGVSFTGIAKSVDFGGTINQIGFDDITFGSDVPGGIGSQPTPEPTSLLGLLGIGAFGSSAVFKRKQQKAKIASQAS